MTEKALTPNPSVVLTALPDGTAVLLHLETKFYFTLNVTGVFVWNLLARSGAEGRVATRAEVLEALTQAFDVEPDVAAPDVDALLGELRAERLLVAR